LFAPVVAPLLVLSMFVALGAIIVQAKRKQRRRARG
jgi:hypothetical protein